MVHNTQDGGKYGKQIPPTKLKAKTNDTEKHYPPHKIHRYLQNGYTGLVLPVTMVYRGNDNFGTTRDPKMRRQKITIFPQFCNLWGYTANFGNND